jgi:hypothetical protein
METYPALRETLKKQMEKNIINIGSGVRKTFSTGSFQTVDGIEKHHTQDIYIT